MMEAALRRLLGIVVLLFLGLGCTGDASDDAAEATAPQTYDDVRGVVQSITPNQRYVVVAHEPIPGYMDAMTMAFGVAEPALLEGVQRGDTIRFVVEVREAEPRITRIYADP